jgi:3-hydroxybutyryl-CoA dehydrogenase
MEIKTVGMVGLGTMGAGIAQLCLQAGFETVGREISPAAAERGHAQIRRFLDRNVEKGRMTAEERDAALGRLTLTTELEDLAGCDAILATNTSALSVTEIAAATKRPDRVVGLHFFNPAPVLPLVEVVRGQLTDEAVAQQVYAFAKAIGKDPILCHDTPGFVVNRVLIPVLNDAVRVIDEARVTPEDLDKACRYGLGWPLGPCALIDLIGVDVQVHASEALFEGFKESRMAAPPRLVNMLNAGLLGRKTGHGFFRYDEKGNRVD